MAVGRGDFSNRRGRVQRFPVIPYDLGTSDGHRLGEEL